MFRVRLLQISRAAQGIHRDYLRTIGATVQGIYVFRVKGQGR